MNLTKKNLHHQIHGFVSWSEWYHARAVALDRIEHKGAHVWAEYEKGNLTQEDYMSLMEIQLDSPLTKVG
jgi:hypothetical protein